MIDISKKILIKDIYSLVKDSKISSNEKKELVVCGWIRNIRDSKDITFIELNDGTYFKSVQIVLDSTLENFKEISALNIGSSIIVNGNLVLTPDAKQPFEIYAKAVEVQGMSDGEYPLQNKRHSMEFLRTIAHLRPRTNTFSAVFRVRSVLAMAIHTYFQEKGFVYVNTPIITCAQCEGEDQMFKITTLDMNNLPKTKDGKFDAGLDLFGRQGYITGSGQLQGEAFAMGFSNIYTFGPTLRTENSNTKVHANEFWMIEPEMAFCDINQLMDIEEDMLKYVIKYVLDKCEEEMKFFDTFIEKGLIAKLQNIITSDFVRITHEDVITLLKKADVKFEFAPEYGEDIAKEHEKYITDYFGKPVFITNWPKDIKAYYMKQNSDGKTVAAVDLEAPGIGEIMGGSQREENYDKLLTRCREMNVDTSTIDWYLELRKYGTVVHSGFGLGFERLLMYITGMENIRDVIPFPRTPGSLKY